MKKQLLLVGHEPKVLKESPGFDAALSESWETRCVATAAEALAELRRVPTTAIVTDLHLGATSGLQFLDAVTEQFPAVHRFILADLADREAIHKCVATAHPVLSKECDGRTLRDALERSGKIETLFGNEVVKKLAARIRKMPSPPTSYFHIVKELQSPNASIDSIGEIVAEDPAVTAKLLQMVNSAQFGLQQRVSNPAEAVLFLGIQTTKSLVLLAHTFSYFDGISFGSFSVEALWAHSLATGRLARAIARAENVPVESSEESFTAGLLHDLGKLLLAANETAEFRRAQALAQAKQLPDWEAEQEVFGATHADLGAWLVAVWGLPLTIVEAVLLHHHPAQFLSKGFCALTAVHAANIISHELTDRQGGRGVSALDINYLANLGVGDRLEVWRQTGRSFAPAEGSD